MQNTDLFNELSAEIAAILASSADSPPRAEWVTRLTHGAAPRMALSEVCEVASELDPAGRLATIEGLLNGLMLRHADDDATTSAVMAILHLHLPVLLEERKQ